MVSKIYYKIFIFSQTYKKAVIFYFSYYEFIMKCTSLNSEVVRKDYDFYFLRDNLLKLYPATIVSILLY